MKDDPPEGVRARTRWDERYADGDWEDEDGRGPIELLERASTWLGGEGWALDLACGVGRNSLALAEMGYSVLAVDLSVEGLRRLRDRSRATSVGERSGGRALRSRIHPVLADAHTLEVRSSAFRAVVDSYFLLRSTFPLIRRALAPGGVLVFETFSVVEIDVLGGDIRREFALERGELVEAFGDFEILLHEEGVFDRPEGERGLARLIARKP